MTFPFWLRNLTQFLATTLTKSHPSAARARRGNPRFNVEPLEHRCLLTAGTLDLTFGGGGIVSNAGAYDVAIQADGKIVAIGSPDFSAARYLSNGSLDPTFGSGGKVTTKMGTGATAWDVAIYPNSGTANDGKIVVAGTATLGGFNNHGFGLVRYNRDGSLDKTFNKSGKVTLDFSRGWDEARAVVIQSDGKIIAAGYSGLAGNNSAFTLARFNVNGGLDTSFGIGGKVITDVTVSEGSELIWDVALQTDGKIIAAGQGPHPVYGNSGLYTFALARYTTNGSLDSSFDNDGIVLDPTGTAAWDVAHAVMVQPDGRIIAAGTMEPPADYVTQMGMMRFNTNGSLDSTFGAGGVALGGAGTGTIVAAALQPDGKIVAAGGTGGNFSLARFNTDGSLDANFDNDGKVVTALGGSEYIRGVALQTDGKIVAAGGGLVRYLGDPPLLAASTPARADSTPITAAAAQPLLIEALEFWQSVGVDTSGVRDAELQIVNLGGTTLGMASGNTILLDDNAAGWGWFVDASPKNHSEFTRFGNQGEQHRMDLLTVVMHELGHLLGHEHDDNGVMTETLVAGVRQTDLQREEFTLTDAVFDQSGNHRVDMWLDDSLAEHRKLTRLGGRRFGSKRRK